MLTLVIWGVATLLTPPGGPCTITDKPKCMLRIGQYSVFMSFSYILSEIRVVIVFHHQLHQSNLLTCRCM